MTRRIHATDARHRVVAIGVALFAMLTGCSSTQPPRFHTLMPAPAATARPPAPAGLLVWEVLPVAVPAGVDRPQWVVQTADGSLTVLEQERWIAPLGEEIHAALIDRLTQVVGASALSAEPHMRWRIRIDVQRFDSGPGREARLAATWALSSDAKAVAALRCHGEFVQTPAASGYVALAQGHKQAVAALADAIGGTLKALSTGQTASCPGPSSRG
jgi:uncharacterized lipoprotein YmbA